MRRAARTDGNHSQIMRALRAVGCSVLDLSQLGGGVPDLLIGVPGRHFRLNLLLEEKDGSKPPSHRRLTKFQEEFHGAWRGQLDVVNSVEEAIAVIEKRRML